MLRFEPMHGARPIGIERAIGKAGSAARCQESRQTLERTINTGRSAAITVDQTQRQGGAPIRIGGTVVGAAGVSVFDNSKDVEISQTAAAAAEGGRSVGSDHSSRPTQIVDQRHRRIELSRVEPPQ